MNDNRIIEIVKFLVQYLYKKEYEQIVAFDFLKRLSANEIKTAVENYPGMLSLPPESGYESIDYYWGNDKSEVNLDFDLWFDDQRSDLTLKLKIKSTGNEYAFAVLDIRVL